MTRALALLVALACALVAGAARADYAPRVVVGSKAFPESWILGEALRALAESGGARAEHAKNLGGTEIVLAALRGGSIDAYVEYTGTIDEVILAHPGASAAERRAALAASGVGVSEPLGFANNYALAISPAAQRASRVTTISELAAHPELRLGLSHEFLGRADGMPGIVARYGLSTANVRGVQHDLAFAAIADGAVDVVDAYTTDAQLDRLGLRVLDDDRRFFPRYDAVILYRLDLPARAPRAFDAMTRLVGAVDARAMRDANAALVLDHQPVESAAARLVPALAAPRAAPRGAAAAIAVDVARHVQLVALSLAAAILLGVPLGVVAARTRALAATTMSFASVVQTVPSLALLALLVPVFGIGARPAIAALFLYAILPIARGTYTGLTTIAPELLDVADALGLGAWAKLRKVTLPLASPAIVAGVRTSAVINVGTATLAALVGAEGLGNPILQGLSLRDTSLILRGAIPAALLALLVEGAFTLIERAVVPRGLRLDRGRAARAA